jgi:hypothetical protein
MVQMRSFSSASLIRWRSMILVVALVVVAEQVVVTRRALVIGVVEATQGDAPLDDLVEDIHVFDELRQDAKAAFGRFVQQDVGRFRIADGDHADFVRFDLEDALDGALEGMLQGDDAVRLQAQRLDRLDIEGIREIGSPEFDQAEFFLEVGIRLGTGVRHGAAPVAGNQADGEAFGFLRAPLGVDVNQTRRRNIAQVEQGAFARRGDGLADAIKMAAIDREIGANFVATRNALLFLAGMRSISSARDSAISIRSWRCSLKALSERLRPEKGQVLSLAASPAMK